MLSLGSLRFMFGGDLVSAILQVQLLGGFQAVWGETPLETVHSPRLQSLLTYLILHPDPPQPRQHLAFLFFPDSSEAQALTNLRNLYHLLHKALPEADRFLQSDRQRLRWRHDAPFTLDVTCFERALHSAITVKDWEEAIRLYSGDLLPGCYDDWILPERERLYQDFVAALEQLVSLFEQTDDYLKARQYAQRLLSTDPLREETYRRLMQLSASCGDHAEVMRYYNQCVQVLRRELGIEPGAETMALYQELLQCGTAPITDSFPLRRQTA